MYRYTTFIKTRKKLKFSILKQFRLIQFLCFLSVILNLR
ncbi:hypothetical protein LEP1GSC074_0929 [Leptospira noguchii str. Hook]|nr:hypothetical protein LEP1GSC074_0929 [Leptospira noguchii str. Hook]